MASFTGYPYAIVLSDLLHACLFLSKRATLTFSVAKLVQAASCKYQMPYSLDFFKNYFADGLAAGKNFSLPYG